MASSAFKSTSRRGAVGGRGSNISNNNDKSSDERKSLVSDSKKAPLRRSQSVSAISRAQLDLASEFLNKIDNPLFSSTGDKEQDEKQQQIAFQPKTDVSSDAADNRLQRGRSATRNADLISNKVAAVTGEKKKAMVGRSLSRVDIGRRHRSVSRGRSMASESEAESESVVAPLISRDRTASTLAPNTVKKTDLGRNAPDSSDNTKTFRSEAVVHPTAESRDISSCSVELPNWEDGISAASLSEAEEKTINAVFEQMKSFKGDNATTNGIYEAVRSEVRRAMLDIQHDLENAICCNNASASVANIPPDLVNPGAVDVVLDIRKEYARKLDESHERARRLRVDLAVEEHRGQELSRILKEILPEPKTTHVHKSRPGRKNSTERKRMSRRLAEEAMAYFDECVSISTFDSSDFSAPEDPPPNFTEAAAPVKEKGCPSVSDSCFNDKQESGTFGQPMQSPWECSIASSSSNKPVLDPDGERCKIAELGRKFQFSLGQNPADNDPQQQNSRSGLKDIGKYFTEDDTNLENGRSSYFDMDEYKLCRHAEELLCERVLHRNRIESGSLHLCGGGGLAMMFSPFASVI